MTAGATNTAGALQIAANTALTLDSGAALTFAGDSAALPWSGSLAISGTLGAQVPSPLRFWPHLLATDQVARITANGKPVLQVSGGYLLEALGQPTWDDGGTNASLDAAANWDSDLLPPFDGSTNVCFALAGTQAVVNVNAAFRAVRIERAADFAIVAGGGTLALGSGGLSATLPDAVSHTYTLAAPVTLAADQIWGITNNGAAQATLVVSGPLDDAPAACSLTQSGNGMLLLAASNTFDGVFTVRTGGIARIAHGWALGGTNGLTVIENGAWLELGGGLHVPEPLSLNGDAASFYTGALRATGGSNTWSGPITQVSGTRIAALNSGTFLELTGGLNMPSGLCLKYDAGALLRVSGKPITMPSYRTIFCHGAGRCELAAAGNTWGGMDINGGTVRLDVPSALPANTALSLGPNGVLDLNGHDTTLAGLASGLPSDPRWHGITSALPAQLTLNDSGAALCHAGLSGLLSFRKVGGGTLTLGRANSLEGGITVANGALCLAADGGFTACTNLIVEGGRLELQTSHGLPNRTTLRLVGQGRAHLATGVAEQIAQLWFDGLRQADGTWGASGSGATHVDDTRFTGAGVLSVVASGSVPLPSLHLAPGGNATNAGTANAPFATLEQARDALRRARYDGSLPPGETTIWLHAGVYARTNTFELAAADSGTPENPVVYRAWPGDEVRIHGGRLLAPEWFTPVTNASPVWPRLDPAARGHVQQADLAAQGISDFGTLRNRGSFYFSGTPAALELFFDRAPQPLARWPDPGESGNGATDGFAWTQTGSTGTTLVYAGTRPGRWSGAAAPWLHGLSHVYWEDQHVGVSGVNTQLQTLTLASPLTYGLRSDQPYYVENLIEELTAPGEWYLDRAAGVLYFWPPAELAGREMLVSLLETPLVRHTHTRWIAWRGVIFEAARGELVAIAGGSHNRILDCTLRNAGGYAARVSGFRNGLSGCTIAHPGDGGVHLSGGDRATLAGSGNFVRDGTLYGFSRWDWMYMPGVDLNSGTCGHIVTGNAFSNAPHAALLAGHGNYHLVARNTMTDLCRWSSDAAAIHLGSGLGSYGTILRHNFIHHIASGFGSGGDGTQGIYIDNCTAGIEVKGNLLYHIANRGIMHNGGRDLRLQNNLLVGCGTGLGAYAIGIGWMMDMGGSFTEWSRLQSLPYRGALWSSHFPALAAMPTNWDTVVAEGWMAPAHSRFERNLGFTNTVWLATSYNATNYYDAFADNLPNSDPRFVDEAALNLALRPDSPAFTIPGFEEIPFAAIGPAAAGPVELAAWDFATAVDRDGFSAALRAAPAPLAVGSGLATIVQAPGHPTWGLRIPSGALTATNEADAVAAEAYLDVPIAPFSGQALALAALTLAYRASGPGATLFLRSSADGFAATLATLALTTTNAWEVVSLPLHDRAALQGCAAPLTLRLYARRAGTTVPPVALDLDNLAITGAMLPRSGHGTLFILH